MAALPFLHISTIFRNENWEITVSQREVSVDLDLVYIANDKYVPEETTGASLDPEFAKKLGRALLDAGYEVADDEDDEDDA